LYDPLWLLIKGDKTTDKWHTARWSRWVISLRYKSIFVAATWVQWESFSVRLMVAVPVMPFRQFTTYPPINVVSLLAVDIVAKQTLYSTGAL